LVHAARAALVSRIGAGVTWVEITEIWLSTGGSAVAGWAIGKALEPSAGG
jgi:hypothetical protein